MTLTQRPEYTAEEFERYWLAGSSMTSEQMREFGRVVRECDCDYSECRGWQMGRTDEIDERIWWEILNTEPIEEQDEYGR